jgi:ligand-binding sensor domain-containing protein
MRARILWMLMVAWVGANSAWALDPTKHLSQYAHTSWRSRDGYFGGSFPTSIAQTRDGFIWITTTNGLMRFDGVRFTRFSPPDGPSPMVLYSLLAAKDDSLWMGADGYIAHWESGRLTRYPTGPFIVLAMREANEGTIWFTRIGGGKPGGLCRLERGESHCYGASDGIEGLGTSALAQDGAGNLWVGGDISVVRWNPSAHVTYPLPQLRSVIGEGVMDLEPAPDSGVWVGMDHVGPGLGLQRLVAGHMQPVIVGKLDGSTLAVTALHYDAAGSLWVGTVNRGIYRIHGETAEQYRSVDGLSGDYVTKFLEDREGTLWVATSRGLDAFHDRGVVSLSSHEGLGTDEVDSVFAARDGTVWVGGPHELDAIRNTGITSIHSPGQVTSVMEDRTGTLWVGIDSTLTVRNHDRFEAIDIPDSDPKGIVTSLTEDVNGNVWAEVRGNPSKLLRIQDRHVREVFVEPRVPAATRLAADPEGGVWLGLRSGNLARLRNGIVETFPNEHGSAAATYPAPIAQLAVRHDGSVLAATNFGLLGWLRGTSRLMTVRNGLPCDRIDALVEDDHATVWLSTPCGLLGLSSEEVNEWWRNPAIRVHPRILDSLDGWEPGEVSFQAAARSVDGRL